VLARGAHHESERAACEHAYTDQQRGHAEDARDGWLREQERRSRTLGVVVRVARGGRVPSRPECEHHSHLRPTHPRGLRVRDAHLACADFRVLILLISVLTLLMLVTGERVEPAESVGKPLFLSYHFPPTIFSLPMSHSHHWLAPAKSVGKPLFLSYHFPPTIFSLPMSHSHHWLAPAESVGEPLFLSYHFPPTIFSP
jgi:hypothetical protein